MERVAVAFERFLFQNTSPVQVTDRISLCPAWLKLSIQNSNDRDIVRSECTFHRKVHPTCDKSQSQHNTSRHFQCNLIFHRNSISHRLLNIIVPLLIVSNFLQTVINYTYTELFFDRTHVRFTKKKLTFKRIGGRNFKLWWEMKRGGNMPNEGAVVEKWFNVGGLKIHVVLIILQNKQLYLIK